MNKTTRFRSTLSGCVLLVPLLCLLTPVQALAQTLAVSGTANLFGAGHSIAPAPGGGGAGSLPPSVTFVPKADLVLTFASVAGSVSCCSATASTNGPDGGTTPFSSTDVASLNGVSGLVHSNRTMFLAGVFLDANEPSGAGPARLSLSDPEDFTDLFPLLGQTFFIGDGRSDTGSQVQRFHVPTGASRLFLGFVDAPSFQGDPGFYDDNSGSLEAIFSISSSSGSFAQIASGGGWKTTLTLVNSGATRVTGVVSFYGDSGSPLTLPLTFPQSGTTATSSFTTLSVEPNATFVVESESTASSVMVGWADVKSSGSLVGYSIFRQRLPGVPDSEGTAMLDTQGSPRLILPYDNTSGFQTGVALATESTVPITINVVLRNDTGNQLGTSQITLPASGHTAFFVNNAFAQTANRRGTVEFRSTSGNITGIGLRFSPTLSFTSLPVIR
jgi:hypothetical protein